MIKLENGMFDIEQGTLMYFTIKFCHLEYSSRSHRVSSALHISKKHLCLGGMAPSEMTHSVSGVRVSLAVAYSLPGVNTIR